MAHDVVVSAGPSRDGGTTLHIASDDGAETDTATQLERPVGLLPELDLPGLPLASALITLHSGALVMRRKSDGLSYADIMFPAWRTLGPESSREFT